jgi:restriction endonuclease S subunit
MAMIVEKNSLHYLAGFAPVRCDTHFKYYIKQADSFFSNANISWAALGSVLEDVRNGMNIKTDYYSMEQTDTLYLSVSQIKEYGLIDKNQNYLTDEVTELENYFELERDMILITRSGTIGVALSTNHPSFNFDECAYVASGFVITAKVKEGFSPNAIAGYINLLDVQKYLTAMAAGACQKNIAQPVVNNLPIPECLLNNDTDIEQFFKTYGIESGKVLNAIALQERQLSQLKEGISNAIKSKIIEHYK